MLAQLADYQGLARADARIASDAVVGTIAACKRAKDNLLLIETSKSSRAVLQRNLAAQGFPVTSVADAQDAFAEIERKEFAFAVVSVGARQRNEFDIVTQLRRRLANLRIVVVTDVDSFASEQMALRAGADNYLAKSADPAELIDALLDRAPELPPVPHTPLGLNRVCWEHIMRVHEQCGRNVLRRRSVCVCTDARCSASLENAHHSCALKQSCPNCSAEVIDASMPAVGDANSHAVRCELQAKES